MNSLVVSNPELVLAASQILRVAHEVEAAEGAIKAELLRAARAGENARVIDILTRWETVPAALVLKSDQTPEQRLIDAGELR